MATDRRRLPWARPGGPMGLRTRMVAYLLGIHLAFAALAVLALRESRLLFLAAEGLLLVSALLGTWLVRSFFLPLDLIRTGAELIRERDFTSTFREVGSPEMDALIGVYNEMIARLREERLKLEEQHYFLDRLLAASPAGVLTLDFDGRVLAANPAAGALLGAEDLPGRPLAAIAPPLGPALAALPVGEARVLALQGGRRVKAARAELFDRGFPRSFFLLEELTAELRASEKAAYGKLIRMMSHEVNNSVGAVGSLLDSFRAYGGQLAEEDRRDFLDGLGVAVARLANLRAFMSGFAEVVRLPPPDPRPCDLKQLVDELLLLLRPELERRRIRWEWQRAEPVPPVVLDRNQMEQVLVNVLQNAMEAIGEDGTIGLALYLDGGRPVLAVRDTGPGIPDEVRPLLFTPFFSTKRDGRGLGLTLIQEILTQHGFAFRLDDWPEGGAELEIGF